MSQSSEEAKARLKREAEELIDKLWAEKKMAEDISLSEIEQIAVKAGMQFRKTIAQQLVEDSQEQKVEKPICQGCGVRLKLKDYRRRRVETEAGEIEVRRAYYYCKACGRGVFPPG
jgi:Pyruvate/2-oxoacid:ferredoxin oxidoreductase delta subunit